jgi:hypothetical protein
MKILCLLLALLSAGPVWAASPSADILDARALGMGGAQRALARPIAAARLNPAALGPERGFFAGSSYATRRASAFDSLSITLVDNITSPMGGAIQYLRLHGDEEREDLSLGLSAGKRGLWWGFTGRYVHGKNPDQAQWRDVITGDLGLLFERPTGTRFVVVGYDVIGTSLDFLQRRVALGVSQSIGKWALEADLVRNLERELSNGIDVHLGAEYRLPRSPWLFRLGQMWRGETGKDYASAGLGWSVPEISLAYAVQKARQRTDEYLHVISLDGSF